MKIDDLYMVEEGSAEWDRMWAALGALELNRDLPEPTVCMEEGWGEAWQYMGTARINGRSVHEFRHRCHPKTGKREYRHIAAPAKRRRAK
jgi:hypothetical protein